MQAAAQPAATSSDGRWRLEAGEPASLVLRDAAGHAVRTWPAAALDGSRPSAVADLRDNPPRRSFLASFATLPELWEISYDPSAEPIFDGLVHDYRMGEGIARSGFLGVRRIPLEAPPTVLAITGQGRHVLASTPAGDGRVTLDVVHLDVRRRIARVPLQVTPAAGTTALFLREGRELFAVGGPEGLQVVDLAANRVVRTLPLGAVRSVRSEPGAQRLEIGVERDGVAATVRVDQRTLEPVSGS